MKSQNNYLYWKVLTPELLELGLFSSSAKISGYLEYQLHIKGTVLYFWSSLSWIVIYYRGLKFPQKAAVLLRLEIDATCTCLHGDCERKSAELNSNDSSKPEMLVFKNCEGTDPLNAVLRSDMTRPQVMVASARHVVCRSNETVTLLCIITWPSTLTYIGKSQVSKHYDSHRWPESPIM